MDLGLRMAYSTDFSTAGRLKRSDGSLRAIMRHNHRTPKLEAEPEVADPSVASVPETVPELESAEGKKPTPKRSSVWRGQGARKWKENIDPVKIPNDRVWLNPLYGGAGWTAPDALPDEVKVSPEAFIMAALKGKLGIDVDPEDGILKYGEKYGGKGGRRRSEAASEKSKGRRKKRKKVREDAVMAVDVVLQASPAFFYPRIREEHWDQERIDTSFVWERGPLDEDAVTAFRDAGLRWATEWWGADLIAEVALHVDESCPHLHIMVIPEADGQLRAGSVVAGPAEARKMLDAAEPFFANIHAGMSLERPEEGGQSTGQTYSKRNRAARGEAEAAERRRDEAKKEAETAEAKSAERKAKAETKAREAEAESARRVQAAEQVAEKAEAESAERKARAETSAREAEAASALRVQVAGQTAEKAEAELADRTARLDRREARLQEWTAACQRTAARLDGIEAELDRRQADQQAVQEAGDEAEGRLRALVRQQPRIRPTEAVRRVAESYRAEAVEERRRAAEAERAMEEAKADMGPFAEFLRLPGRVARAVWDALAALLDERVPTWLQDMRRQAQELQDEERRRQEAETSTPNVQQM